jgi:hypothetical protein
MNQIFSRQGNIIEQAKAHAAVDSGVMPWRTGESQTTATLALPNRLRYCQRSTNSVES